MNKEKRNIAKKLETESKYLTNILDRQDVKEFKKLIPELQDTWKKKQMFLFSLFISNLYIPFFYKKVNTTILLLLIT